ncbi:hypothetical protein [Metabacillus litoralis]|jgi:predicted amidohydrolase YtcJ|nr:hypothetical protein [Metabacillus litoralis]MCM3650999.1 hypothetical protein [Metabacillus litoralis]
MITDVLLINGEVITADQNSSVIEAVAVKGNRIVLGKTSKSSKKCSHS